MLKESFVASDVTMSSKRAKFYKLITFHLISEEEAAKIWKSSGTLWKLLELV